MVKLNGDLNQMALERALTSIVARHEILRTTIDSVEGTPLQTVASVAQLVLAVVDRRAQDEESRQHELHKLADEEARRPFDLSSDLMLRATLVKSGDTEHVLLLTLHHIAADGWSLEILFRELSELYSAYSQEREPKLTELPIQYADYARWQEELLSGKLLETQLEYWKEQLPGGYVLQIPTDRARPSVQSYRGATVRVELSEKLSETLRELTGREGLITVLLTAFKVLLYRYSGQEDIRVGIPAANRARVETEGLIGMFVNTLVVRTDLSGEPTFREVLRRVNDSLLGAREHGDAPFETVVKALQPERNSSYTPLFQVMFAPQDGVNRAFEMGDVQAQASGLANGTAKFDLTVSLSSEGKKIEGAIEYSTDLYDAETVRRMVEHYRSLLDAMVKDPDQLVSTAPMLTEAERRRILVEWNDTRREYPQVCIHQIIEQQVERTPEAVACIFDEERLSYRELNERANRVAHYLRKRGAGPDVPIGIFIERSVNLIVGILGILKAGSAYVPLDPDYPVERLGYILEVTQAPVVLTQGSLAGELRGFVGQQICLDTDWGGIARESDENPVTEVKSHHLAYVLFTSGSTGRPKGVALEHRTPATFAQWSREVFTPGELAGVLFGTSVSFDVSVFEILVTLSAGGKVIVARNALQLPEMVAREEVTLINTVPTIMAELMRLGGLPDSVKTVNLAGEVLADALVEQIYATTRVEKVYNLYGPTETSYSTWTLVTRGSRVTIGKPLANTRVYILDDRLEPAPVGVIGDLWIGGDGLARGYWKQPELTSQKFLTNVLSEVRLYKTGDLARYLPDGNIEFLGRLDHQVKIRGFRVELGEIEATLRRHPGVHSAAVLMREDTPGEKRIVAYVVAAPGQRHAREDLRSFLKQKLPEYMVPSSFEYLSALPLTAHGKVDRRALPAPGTAVRETACVFTPPRTEVEKVLTGIFAEVLQRKSIGIEDDFFDLGGHSLLAMKVLSRVNIELGARIPLREFYQAPTVAALAATIDPSKTGNGQSIQRRRTTAPCRLSFAQEGLWVLDRLAPDSPLYNIPLLVKLSGNLNQVALERALDSIVVRHEILRTTIDSVEGIPQQRVAPVAQLVLAVVDLRAQDEGSRQQELHRLADQEARQSFDLSSDLMLRATLVKSGDTEHVLLLTLHHIAADGWSLEILFRELSELYSAYSQEREPRLTELPIQYADYARVARRSGCQGSCSETQLEYWKEQLPGGYVLQIPTDRARPTRAKLPWRHSPRGAQREAFGIATGTDRTGRLNYSSADGIQGTAISLQRAGRYPGRDSGGEPCSGGDRRADRNVCEHSGGADGPERRTNISRSAAAREGEFVERPGTRGCTVRDYSASATAGAKLELHTFVSGDVCASGWGQQDLRDGRCSSASKRFGERYSEIRLDCEPIQRGEEDRRSD